MEFQPVVISGPSGVGKSTLVKRLMGEYEDCFAFSVSHTTRKPRLGEKNGKDYNFVTRQQMEEAMKNKEFIESAEYSGNLYGTSKKAVDDVKKTGRICILDIEMQGVKSVKDTDLEPKYIFVKPPSLKVLEDRLKLRGSETEESLTRRLRIAEKEIEYGSQKGAYDHIVENGNLEVAYEKLKGILIKDIDTFMKEKHKAH